MAGRYRLGAQIGRGGMGVVWEAVDEVLGRLVAIKEVIPPTELDEGQREQLRQRTLREAQAAARMRGTGSVTVHDVVDEDGRPWIVMERLEARTLADVVRDEGPLPPSQVAQIGRSLLDTLGAAHSAGVLHRDVKPSNVMLADRGAVLTDFGIAQVEGDSSLTTTGMLIGSPSFMAPERARGEPATPASDLWSLGATLYAAVEGRAPYERDTQLATLHAVVNDDPPPMDRAGALEPALSALDKDPSRRPDHLAAGRLLDAGPQAPTVAVAHPTRELEGPPPASPRRGRRPVVRLLVALLVITGLIAAVVLVSRGDEDSAGTDDDVLPAPFTSDRIYAFVGGLFSPEQCEVPAPGERLQVEELPDVEALACLADERLSAVFWCKETVQQLRAERMLYRRTYIPDTVTPVEGEAPGSAAADVQLSALRKVAGDARLYWDSEELLCGGEIIRQDDDVDAAVDFWSAG